MTYVHRVMGSRLTRRSLAVGEFLRSNWHVVTTAVTAGAIVCGAVFLLSTMPPRSITMATGPEGGGYYEIGKKYQELLARTGVELRLVETPGSVENLALLRDPHSGVNIALVQGGSVGQAAGELEFTWNTVLRAAVDLPSRRPGGRDTGRPARSEGLDRTGRQRYACTSAEAAQAQ